MAEPSGTLNPEPRETKPLNPDDVLRILKLSRNNIKSALEIQDALDSKDYAITSEDDREIIDAFNKWMIDNNNIDPVTLQEHLADFFSIRVGAASGKPEALPSGAGPLNPEQITYWSDFLRKHGYHFEKLSPGQLRGALGHIYGIYLKKDQDNFFKKQDSGDIPKKARYSNKRAGDSLSGEDQEAFNELRGLKEFLDSVDDKQVTDVLGKLFNIEKPKAKKPQEKKPNVSKPEEKKPAPNPEKEKRDNGEEVDVEKLRKDLEDINVALADKELERMEGKLGRPSILKERLLHRKAELEKQIIEAEEKKNKNKPANNGGGATAPQAAQGNVAPDATAQQNKESEKEAEALVATLKEAADALKAKTAKSQAETKLKGGADIQKDIPVAGSGETSDLDKFNQESIRLEKERAAAANMPVAKIAPPLSKRELLDLKKDELQLLNKQSEMLQGFGEAEDLSEKREKLFGEIGKAVGEDFKKKVNVETKKKLGKKEMNPQKFREREMPKVLKEIAAEQRKKAEAVCRESGWGKKLFEQDQKDGGTRFDFYMKQRLELSELTPEEFYGMIGRGVRVDLFREKVAFWRTVGNWITGNKSIAHKYEIPTGAEGTGGVIKLSEKRLEAFLFDQQKKQEDEIKKLSEEKFAQILKAGQAKLRETRAKVAEDIVGDLAKEAGQRGERHAGAVKKLEELGLPALSEDEREALMAAGYDLENMAAKYETVTGKDVGLLHKNMGAGTFTEYLVIPQENGQMLKIRRDEFAEKVKAFKEKFDKERAKTPVKKEKPAGPVKKKKEPKKKDEQKAPEPPVPKKVETPEDAPESEDGKDFSLARRELLKSKELDKTISPEEFGELLGMDFKELQGMTGPDFNPEEELRHIKEETSGSNKERRGRLESFKQRLELQREGLASCRLFIERIIEFDNNVPLEALLGWVKLFSAKYSFTKEQGEAIREIIDGYYEQRGLAKSLYEKHKGDKVGLVNELMGQELFDPSDASDFKISLDHMGINIKTNNKNTEILFQGTKDPIMASSSDTAAFAGESSGAAKVFYTVINTNELKTGSEEEEDFRKHENDHHLRRIFKKVIERKFLKKEESRLLGYYREAKENKEETNARVFLSNYLNFQKDRALFNARDEIIAMLRTIDLDKLPEEVEAHLYAGKDEDYDYGLAKIEHAEEFASDKLYKKMVAEILGEQYEWSIKNAVESLVLLINSLAKKDMTLEQAERYAVALLTDKELIQWPKTVDGILESKGIITERQKNKAERKKQREQFVKAGEPLVGKKTSAKAEGEAKKAEGEIKKEKEKIAFEEKLNKAYSFDNIIRAIEQQETLIESHGEGVVGKEYLIAHLKEAKILTEGMKRGRVEPREVQGFINDLILAYFGKEKYYGKEIPLLEDTIELIFDSAWGWLSDDLKSVEKIKLPKDTGYFWRDLVKAVEQDNNKAEEAERALEKEIEGTKNFKQLQEVLEKAGNSKDAAKVAERIKDLQGKITRSGNDILYLDGVLRGNFYLVEEGFANKEAARQLRRLKEACGEKINGEIKNRGYKIAYSGAPLYKNSIEDTLREKAEKDTEFWEFVQNTLKESLGE